MENRPAVNLVHEPDEDNLYLGDLLDVLIDARWLILGIALAMFLLGAFKAYTATPIYRADVLLQVEERQSQMIDLGLSSPFGRDTSVNAEMEILRSRSVLGPVVDKLNLDIDTQPQLAPLIGAAIARGRPRDEQPVIQVDRFDVPESRLGQTFEIVGRGGGRFDVADAEGLVLGAGTVGEPLEFALPDGETMSLFVSRLQPDAGQAFTVRRKSRISSISQLQARLQIEDRGEGSGILALSLEGPAPESLYEEINAIADSYVQKNVERKSAEAQNTLDFLDEQLPVVRQKLQTAEAALNTYRLEKGSVDLPLETQGILQNIVSVESELSELRRERESALQQFTPQHPTVIALDKQIDRLAAQLGDLNARVRDLPNTQQEILRLKRDVEVNTALYTSLLNTAQELRVVKAGTVGNVRVVDYAVLPQSPVKPNRPLLVLAGLLAGILLGIVVAFTRKAFRTGVEDPDLIERHVSIPVYATIAHSGRQEQLYREHRDGRKGAAILAVDSPNDVAIESLRNLQTALHFGTIGVKNNCIMITGPSPGVGKSFVSINLAAVLTGNGKKVLLVDGDMRRGHLHRYLGVERENGLSDFIGGEVAIGGVLRHSILPDLTFISSGRLPPNPPELLLHQRFTNCLSVLTPRYDHIIIDSPPILAATDATIIGQMAGATLMVIKSGAHPMREIDQSVKRLKRAGVNLRGFVMNDIPVHRRYGTGKYAYQYAYESTAAPE